MDQVLSSYGVREAPMFDLYVVLGRGLFISHIYFISSPSVDDALVGCVSSLLS